MEEQAELTLEELVRRLPRSVIDVNQDGSFNIHPVDMVQAQMDREKEFDNLLSQASAMAVKIEQLQAQLKEQEVEEVTEEATEE